MNITVPVPTFERRLVVPIPSLSRKQLLFMGGAATLGIVDVLSAPVAALVASAPLLQKGVRRLAGTGEGGGAPTQRRTTARRGASTRSRGTATTGRSAARGRGTSTGPTTRRSTRSPRRSGTSTTSAAPSA